MNWADSNQWTKPSVVQSPPGVQAPLNAINYTPDTSEIHAPGAAAPVDKTNLSLVTPANGVPTPSPLPAVDAPTDTPAQSFTTGQPSLEEQVRDMIAMWSPGQSDFDLGMGSDMVYGSNQSPASVGVGADGAFTDAQINQIVESLLKMSAQEREQQLAALEAPDRQTVEARLNERLATQGPAAPTGRVADAISRIKANPSLRDSLLSKLTQEERQQVETALGSPAAAAPAEAPIQGPPIPTAAPPAAASEPEATPVVEGGRKPYEGLDQDTINALRDPTFKLVHPEITEARIASMTPEEAAALLKPPKKIKSTQATADGGTRIIYDDGTVEDRPPPEGGARTTNPFKIETVGGKQGVFDPASGSFTPLSDINKWTPVQSRRGAIYAVSTNDTGDLITKQIVGPEDIASAATGPYGIHGSMTEGGKFTPFDANERPRPVAEGGMIFVPPGGSPDTKDLDRFRSSLNWLPGQGDVGTGEDDGALGDSTDGAAPGDNAAGGAPSWSMPTWTAANASMPNGDPLASTVGVGADEPLQIPNGQSMPSSLPVSTPMPGMAKGPVPQQSQTSTQPQPEPMPGEQPSPLVGSSLNRNMGWTTPNWAPKSWQGSPDLGLGADAVDQWGQFLDKNPDMLETQHGDNLEWMSRNPGPLAFDPAATLFVDPVTNQATVGVSDAQIGNDQPQAWPKQTDTPSGAVRSNTDKEQGVPVVSSTPMEQNGPITLSTPMSVAGPAVLSTPRMPWTPASGATTSDNLDPETLASKQWTSGDMQGPISGPPAVIPQGDQGVMPVPQPPVQRTPKIVGSEGDMGREREPEVNPRDDVNPSRGPTPVPSRGPVVGTKDEDVTSILRDVDRAASGQPIDLGQTRPGPMQWIDPKTFVEDPSMQTPDVPQSTSPWAPGNVDRWGAAGSNPVAGDARQKMLEDYKNKYLSEPKGPIGMEPGSTEEPDRNALQQFFHDRFGIGADASKEDESAEAAPDVEFDEFSIPLDAETIKKLFGDSNGPVKMQLGRGADVNPKTLPLLQNFWGHDPEGHNLNPWSWAPYGKSGGNASPANQMEDAEMPEPLSLLGGAIRRGALGTGADYVPPVPPETVLGNGNRFGQQVEMEGTHKGFDLQSPEGTPTQSPVDGTVVKVMTKPEGLGLQVYVLDPATGEVHIMSHLASALVKEGDQVKAGQEVGTVGESGAGATGPHLDYRIQDAATGAYKNPEPRLGPLAKMPMAPNTVGAGADTPDDNYWNYPAGEWHDDPNNPGLQFRGGDPNDTSNWRPIPSSTTTTAAPAATTSSPAVDWTALVGPQYDLNKQQLQQEWAMFLYNSGLSEAQVTGVLNGQPTLAKQQLDQAWNIFQAQMAHETDLSGTYQQRRQAQLTDKALANPWLAALGGMAPAWKEVGGPGGVPDRALQTLGWGPSTATTGSTSTTTNITGSTTGSTTAASGVTPEILQQARQGLASAGGDQSWLNPATHSDAEVIAKIQRDPTLFTGDSPVGKAIRSAPAAAMPAITRAAPATNHPSSAITRAAPATKPVAPAPNPTATASGMTGNLNLPAGFKVTGGGFDTGGLSDSLFRAPGAAEAGTTVVRRPDGTTEEASNAPVPGDPYGRTFAEMLQQSYDAEAANPRPNTSGQGYHLDSSGNYIRDAGFNANPAAPGSSAWQQAANSDLNWANSLAPAAPPTPSSDTNGGGEASVLPEGAVGQAGNSFDFGSEGWWTQNDEGSWQPDEQANQDFGYDAGGWDTGASDNGSDQNANEGDDGGDDDLGTGQDEGDDITVPGDNPQVTAGMGMNELTGEPTGSATDPGDSVASAPGDSTLPTTGDSTPVGNNADSGVAPTQNDPRGFLRDVRGNQEWNQQFGSTAGSLEDADLLAWLEANDQGAWGQQAHNYLHPLGFSPPPVWGITDPYFSAPPETSRALTPDQITSNLDAIRQQAKNDPNNVTPWNLPDNDLTKWLADNDQGAWGEAAKRWLPSMPHLPLDSYSAFIQSGTLPSWKDFNSWTPFQKAAARTNIESQGTPWETEAYQLRNKWGNEGGPTVTPSLTRLQYGTEDPAQRLNQEFNANTFGEPAANYWSRMSKTWQLGNSPQVAVRA